MKKYYYLLNDKQKFKRIVECENIASIMTELLFPEACWVLRTVFSHFSIRRQREFSTLGVRFHTWVLLDNMFPGSQGKLY